MDENVVHLVSTRNIADKNCLQEKRSQIVFCRCLKGYESERIFTLCSWVFANMQTKTYCDSIMFDRPSVTPSPRMFARFSNRTDLNQIFRNGSL